MDKNVVKLQILEYMQKECCGVRRAKPRHEICEDLVLEDRLFRRIALDLKREGHIATTAQDGYFWVPLVCNDPEDIEAIKHSINDMRSRAYDLLETAKLMADKLEQNTNKQMTFA